MFSIYECAHLIPLGEFIKCVMIGLFTDYDGSGVLCDGQSQTHIAFSCRDIYNNKKTPMDFDKRWTHVCWYNK